METEMSTNLTPETLALIDEYFPKPPPPKPKVIARDGEIIRDAKVRVSTDDPNAVHGEVVEVRRPDFVTIDMAAYEAQREAEAWARAADRAHRRAIDPFGYGHWGTGEDD
jgi:uncharacterized protein YndB with AHSA1/START domain